MSVQDQVIAIIAEQAMIEPSDIALTDMCGQNPIRYHPGAVAAWEEAGYTIPDCAQ